MGYFNYHATATNLIKTNHCQRAELKSKHNNISPALVLIFDNHKPMPIRKESFDKYFSLLYYYDVPTISIVDKNWYKFYNDFMEKYLIINDLHSCIYLPEAEPKEVVIGIHGFSGDKESSVLIELSKHLNKNDVALFTFDLPCHGQNACSTPLNLSECIASIKHIFDFAKENFAGVPISAFATSFGGYLLLNYLSKHHENLNKVILRAPAIYMSEILENVILPFNNFSAKDLSSPINLGFEKPLFVDNKFLTDLRNNNLENLPKNQDFLYIIQGKKDDIVDPIKNESFFKTHYLNQHKFIWFEEADHRFKKIGELDRIINETLDILNLNK